MSKITFNLTILFFVFSGALYLETLMPFLATVQLLAVMTGIIASFILVYSEMAEKEWAHPYATVFYSFALADLIFLAFMTRDFVAFLAVSFFATLGLIRAAFKTEDNETASLETYDAGPQRVESVPLLVKPRKRTAKKTPEEKPLSLSSSRDG